jgi:hypothetical protein
MHPLNVWPAFEVYKTITSCQYDPELWSGFDKKNMNFNCLKDRMVGNWTGMRVVKHVRASCCHETSSLLVYARQVVGLGNESESGYKLHDLYSIPEKGINPSRCNDVQIGTETRTITPSKE